MKYAYWIFALSFGLSLIGCSSILNHSSDKQDGTEALSCDHYTTTAPIGVFSQVIETNGYGGNVSLQTTWEDQSQNVESNIYYFDIKAQKKGLIWRTEQIIKIEPLESQMWIKFLSLTDKEVPITFSVCFIDPPPEMNRGLVN